MSKSQTVSRIDKFLGINEADDSRTELKLGEASKMVNWQITDGANISTRPGFARAPIKQINIDGIENAVITGMWTGYLLNNQYLVIIFGGMQQAGYKSAIAVYSIDENAVFTCVASKTIAEETKGYPNKIFYLFGRLYAFIGEADILCIELEESSGNVTITTERHLYSPVVLTGTAPAGGGTVLEPLNLLNPDFRVRFSSDGKSTAYVLPANADYVSKIVIDNVEKTNVSSVGSFNAENHTFTFTSANIPKEGINNVEFYVGTSSLEFSRQAKKFFAMPFCEAYNGSTDNRLFFYGDGTNITYYTGVPSEGEGLYLPAMNEVAVDFTDAPITGMIRDFSRLLVFTKDGTANITYSPVTLADGSVIAGFYVRTTSREIGNEAAGQVQMVGNYPRTIFRGDLYEWRVSSSTYQDERYSKRISDRIRKTLSAADVEKIVTCDNNDSNTYYMFLNDEAGTMLVNNYQQDAWTIYRSKLAKGVKYAKMCADHFLFATETDLYYLTKSASMDAPLPGTDDQLPIEAVWESGYMHFGADYLRKYSSEIWVSTLPQASSYLTVTAATDRRDDYTEKTITNNIFMWENLDFAHFSFNSSTTPKMKRTKIKVKKFVYYKLIFRVTHPGTRATVLSVDQTVRYAGKVK